MLHYISFHVITVRDDGCFGGRATQFCNCTCYLGLFTGDNCTGMEYSVVIRYILLLLLTQCRCTNQQ